MEDQWIEEDQGMREKKQVAVVVEDHQQTSCDGEVKIMIQSRNDHKCPVA